MFKYGSFFGVSAVHLMFMRPKDIDRIFQFINLKPSMLSLIQNLYMEGKLLKEIFSQTSTKEGIPHVIMKKDLQAPEVLYLINGLNNFIASKQQLILPETEESMANLEELDDWVDIPAGDAAQATSFFGDNSNEDTDNSEASANLFDDLDSLADLNMVDLSAPLPQYSYTDLIEWGKGETPNTAEIANMVGLTRYMRLHRKDFTDEEYSSITKQIADLPSIPIRVVLPETLKQASAPPCETTVSFLRVLYTKMSRKVGDLEFIDYVLKRMEQLLFTKTENSRLIFFAPLADFSRDKTVPGMNYFIHNLQEQYLQTTNTGVLTSNIDILLNNCDEVLGLNQTDSEREKLCSIKEKLSEWEANPAAYPIDRQKACVIELLDFVNIGMLNEQEQEVVENVISRLTSMHILKKLITNPDNLKFVITLFCTMYTCVTKDMYSSLQLYHLFKTPAEELDLETLNDQVIDAFTKFTRETGICGLYCRFEESFYGALKNIEAPLAERSYATFAIGSNNYNFARLLRLQLLSLRKRLSRKGVKQ